MGEHFSLVLKHLRSCSQGFFWAVVVRGPGRGGRGQDRPGLGTSRSTVISCWGLTSAGEQVNSGGRGCLSWRGRQELGMVAFSPESFGKVTALRLAVGEGLSETPFIALSGNYGGLWSTPLEGWSGSLQAAPLPAVSLPHLREAWAASPWSAPKHPATLSLSFLESLPPSTRHSSCRSGGGLDMQPWIFSLQEAGREEEVLGAWC